MTDQASGSEARQGLFASLKGLLATLLGIGRTRVDLLVVEIEEEKQRLMALWAKAIAAAFLLSLGVVMGVLSLAMAFWEHRILLLGGGACLFVAIALWLVISLRAQAGRPSGLFRSSLAELDADIAQLRGRPHE